MRKFLPYLHETIEQLQRFELKRFVVYGSFVDGSASKHSDIDVAIQVRYKKNIKKARIIIDQANKQLLNDGFSHIISAVIDTTFDLTHLSNGIMLWGEPVVLTTKQERLEKKTLITYNTTSLSQQQRAELSRRLFGYTTRIGGKTYGFEGVLEGHRLRNGLLVHNEEDVVGILKDIGVEHKSADIFVRPHVTYVEK